MYTYKTLVWGLDAIDVQELSIAGVAGLECSAGSLGIKRDQSPDAAAFVLPRKSAYAGVFTSNVFRSACVDSALTRLHAGKEIRAVLITSGNANAGTGLAGRADTEMMAAAVGEELGCAADEVIVLHTGVIGVPLGAKRLLPALAPLLAARSADREAGHAAARAMMTTDTVSKTAVRHVDRDGVKGTIGGVAKGAGMIHPRLATMLSVIVTDIPVASPALQVALMQAVKTSFNAISVDGDTSPNDSVILLSCPSDEAGSFTPGAMVPGTQAFATFCAALTEVCEDLARMIVRDGEGATKFLEIVVTGAESDDDAERVAVTIATSPLVKTAFYGEDFNPGRIISAVGRSGAAFDLAQLRMQIGGLSVFAEGLFLGVDPVAAREVMARTDIVIEIALGSGGGRCRFYTCDLTDGYVRINAEYTT